MIRYGPLLDVFVLDMRTYRDANSPNRQPTRAARHSSAPSSSPGSSASCARSRATWKVIAADMPLGLVVAGRHGGTSRPSPRATRARRSGGSWRSPSCSRCIKQHGVRNVVWLTADVHYAAAHHYDPPRAAFTDFDPFWEFVAGPLNAGTFGPNALEPTFGPQAVFVESALFPNQAPTDGRQYFGHVTVDAEAMVVRLLNIAGTTLHTTEIAATT